MGSRADGDQIGVEGVGIGGCLPGNQPGLHEGHQTLQPHGEAHRRGRAATELGHQAVVASTGADRALGAQVIGDPLEDGAVIVIQTAHQTRIDLIGDASGGEPGAKVLEVAPGRLPEMIEDDGGAAMTALRSGFLESSTRRGLVSRRRRLSSSRSSA